MKIILCVLFTLLLFIEGIQGQTKGLKIGHKLPKLKKTELINNGNKPIEDADIIIYDFFDTFCSNCIESMPKLKSIQNKLGKKVQIFMVTWQDRQTIEQFYAGNKFLKENNAILPTIVGDKQLKELFPHNSVPHVVIIKEKHVKAITFGDFVTEKALLSLIDKNEMKASLKDDFLQFPQQKAMFDNVIASVILKKYSDDWPQWEGIKETKEKGGTTKIVLSNTGILAAYKALYSRIKKPEYLLGNNRIIWQNVDKDKLEYPEGSGGMQKWLSTNGICYERSCPLPIDSIAITKTVLNDLNQFFGLNVYFEKRIIPCLILQRSDSINSPDSQASQGGQRLEGSSVLAFLVDYSGLFPPVFDEVKNKDMITLGNFTNLTDLNKQLQRAGLKLVEGQREMEVLIVSKR